MAMGPLRIVIRARVVVGCGLAEVFGRGVTPLDRQRSLAVGWITRRVRFDSYGAWTHAPEKDRREFAARVLFARLRLNRAGLLRWRREPRRGDVR
jgi:hypothetical protein